MNNQKQWALQDGKRVVARHDEELVFIMNPFMSHETARQLARWILAELGEEDEPT